MTEKEQKYIKNNYLKLSSKKIGEKIGLSKTVVQRFKNNNNLIVPPETILKWKSSYTNKNFSKKDDKYIRENYLIMTYSEIRSALNKSKGMIPRRIKKLGLIIPKKIMDERVKATQYGSGHVPANKGLKQADYMSAEQIEKTKGTRFKKGDRPPNYNQVGDITKRIDSNGRYYYHIKIKADKGVHSVYNYMELHRFIWIRENGPIPKKGIIAFKNGNTMDCRPSNLELITMQENMERNSGQVHLLDGYVASLMSRKDKNMKAELMKKPDLIELKRQSILLNRKINEHLKS